MFLYSYLFFYIVIYFNTLLYFEKHSFLKPSLLDSTWRVLHDFVHFSDMMQVKKKEKKYRKKKSIFSSSICVCNYIYNIITHTYRTCGKTCYYLAEMHHLCGLKIVFKKAPCVLVKDPFSVAGGCLFLANLLLAL